MSLDPNRSNSASRADYCDEWSVPGDGPHVVVIDHHDSFTYNLVQSLSRTGAQISVRQADRGTPDRIEDLHPDRILLSPGPGAPKSASLAAWAVRHYRGKIPILGVCLGHQVLAESFGGEVVQSGNPVHGKAHPVLHAGVGIFSGVSQPFLAARYHSLKVLPASLTPPLAVMAWTEEGEVMGLAVPGEATWGLQFHPESFLTPEGDLILESFVEGVSCPEDVDRTAFFEFLESVKEEELS